MNILVIKQTSLGDVLHSSGHIRAIKNQYPDCRLVVLTANSAEQIFSNNSSIDELILIDRYGFKRNWWRKPIWAFREITRVCQEVRKLQFDIAFDLQGLAKSVLFLYAAKAKQKYVKGNWIGLNGFKDKSLHAIDEMSRLLGLAGIHTDDVKMEFGASVKDQQAVNLLIGDLNPSAKPIVVMSPFSRWPSKDWPIDRYIELAERLSANYLVLFTGAPDKQTVIDEALTQLESLQIINLAGKLSILEFTELVRRARFMVTGDSFPMHVSSATQTPVLALFGPTNEKRVGPRGEDDRVLRVDGCEQCKKRNCPRYCLGNLQTDRVSEMINDSFSLKE